MTLDQLVPLLIGPVAGLVLSLVLNWFQFRGRLVDPKRVVMREDYDALKLEQAADRLLLAKIAEAVTEPAAPTLRRRR